MMMAGSSYSPLSDVVAIVGPQFCAPNPLNLYITEKTWNTTGGDYTVTDTNGNMVFKFKGKMFSLRNNRVLLDAARNPLVTMQRKIGSTHGRWKAYRGDSTDDKDLLFSAKLSSHFQLKRVLDVFLAANTREDICDFKIKESYFERSCTIYKANSTVIVAQMSRKYTWKNILHRKETFEVTIYPNVDYAFIVALIVILVEISRD
ncbi:protein LURP-one-related 10-like [Tasmannia lanceolata]|uniref:protein LURP-one-related 10-like n=1 Tax=Tasmannia lanceolata TaxID=3420 RepID=UPI0040629634